MEIFIADKYVEFITDDGDCYNGMAFLSFGFEFRVAGYMRLNGL